MQDNYSHITEVANSLQTSVSCKIKNHLSLSLHQSCYYCRAHTLTSSMGMDQGNVSAYSCTAPNNVLS